jgi:HAD superfamily hydrolase (TIGR01509 family)
MISAIIFDCDGVLVDSEILAVEVETAMLAEAGLDYDHAAFKARFMGMSDKAFFAALDADSRARLGRPLPEGFAERCGARLQAEVRHRITEVSGAGAALSTLAHVRAVASSSTSEKLRIKLALTGLWDYFAPHVYSADHVTHAKPAPDLFLYAANGIATEPSRCLVLEDSVNGVLAARAAGMRVWGFAGGGHMDAAACRRLAEAGAERIVESWPAASALFRTLA